MALQLLFKYDQTFFPSPRPLWSSLFRPSFKSNYPHLALERIQDHSSESSECMSHFLAVGYCHLSTFSYPSLSLDVVALILDVRPILLPPKIAQSRSSLRTSNNTTRKYSSVYICTIYKKGISCREFLANNYWLNPTNSILWKPPLPLPSAIMEVFT